MISIILADDRPAMLTGIAALVDDTEIASRRRDFMTLTDVNQESMRVFRADSKQALINFLNRPLDPGVRRGIIDDLATFLTGERRSTLHTWVPIATGEKIPIVRVCERYSDDPDDWSLVLISNQDLSVEAAAAR